MSWQEVLRSRLVERNARESAYAGIIEQYRRLAQQTRLLKTRNQTLLRATSVATTRSNPNASTVLVNEDDPVRTAYIQSLESEISHLRDEMSAVYKTQGQNAQRLLAINETLREREDSARADTESLRQAREEVAQLRRKVEQHSEQMAEKDRVIQTLTDDVTMLNLEYTTMEEQKEELRKDNATLLQRWIDRMNSEVDKLNDANAFYDDMRTRWHATTQGDEASNGRLHTQASRESLASTGSLVSSPGNGSRSNQGTSPAKGGLGADPKLPKAGLLLNPNG